MTAYPSCLCRRLNFQLCAPASTPCQRSHASTAWLRRNARFSRLSRLFCLRCRVPGGGARTGAAAREPRLPDGVAAAAAALPPELTCCAACRTCCACGGCRFNCRFPEAREPDPGSGMLRSSTSPSCTAARRLGRGAPPALAPGRKVLAALTGASTAFTPPCASLMCCAKRCKSRKARPHAKQRRSPAGGGGGSGGVQAGTHDACGAYTTRNQSVECAASSHLSRWAGS